MRRGGLGGVLLLVYVIIGAFVAGGRGYFGDVSDLGDILAAVLAILLWPLLLVGISLRL